MLRFLKKVFSRKNSDEQLERAATLLRLTLSVNGLKWFRVTENYHEGCLDVLAETLFLFSWRRRYPSIAGFPVRWKAVSEPI